MSSGAPHARAAAADTMGHLCTPPQVSMPNSEGKVVSVEPRGVCVNAGCVEHLVAMLAMPEESCVFEAAETLEILAPSAAAKTAVSRAGGVDALNQVGNGTHSRSPTHALPHTHSRTHSQSRSHTHPHSPWLGR
jgi:hypothetical protein